MNKQRSDIRVIIGSSSESKEIAEYLQLALDEYYETTIWDQGVFKLSTTGLTSLINEVVDYDFAILIYAADDVTIKRNIEKSAPRDNVIFESGLFMGILGLDRTYLVYCKDDDLHIPSDLHGVTLASFKRRKDNNLHAAITPVAVKIRETIRKVGARSKSTNLPIADSTASIPDVLTAIKYLADLSQSIKRGFGGITLKNGNKRNIEKWTKNLIGMLWDIFSKRQSDVYVAWLRPITNPDELSVFQHKNLKKPNSHHTFRIGEGFAGRVWRDGKTAATSQLRKHEWWVFREGCENTAYICSCVGDKGSFGGILAVGSDKGFDISTGDEEIVAAFASILEVAACTLESLQTI